LRASAVCRAAAPAARTSERREQKERAERGAGERTPDVDAVEKGRVGAAGVFIALREFRRDRQGAAD
jgi:hypothetical protein